MPDTIVGKPSCGSEPHWPSASRADATKPSDSSSGVVCALPTTNDPRSSTMNVSVIVPPASIASTRGTPAPGASTSRFVLSVVCSSEPRGLTCDNQLCITRSAPAQTRRRQGRGRPLLVLQRGEHVETGGPAGGEDRCHQS